MTDETDFDIIARQLNRAPDGFQEVVRRNPAGDPAVIRVASVVNRVPFPTLFWISDPELVDLIYQYESSGTTHLIQQSIDENEDLCDRLIRDNEEYIRLRESYFDETVCRELKRLGVEDSFAKKGIGGVANFSRVRCLHSYLGAHVVNANLVGELLTSHHGESDPLVIALSRLN